MKFAHDLLRIPPPQTRGNVGAPDATTVTAHAPIPYYYTTTIGGQVTAILSTFTPTNPTITPTTIPALGTPLSYDEWVQEYLGGVVPTSGSFIPRIHHALYATFVVFITALLL